MPVVPVFERIRNGTISAKSLIYSICSLETLAILSTLICGCCGVPNPAWNSTYICVCCGANLIDQIAPAFIYCGEWRCDCKSHDHRYSGKEVASTIECRKLKLSSVIKNKFLLLFRSFAKTLWIQARVSILRSKSHSDGDDLAFNFFLNKLKEVIWETHELIVDNSLPGWKSLCNWLSRASPDELASVRTYLCLVPGAAAKLNLYTTKAASDLLYATIPIELVHVITCNRLLGQKNSPYQWPTLGANHWLEGQLILNDIAQVVGSSAITDVEAFKEILAKKIIRSDLRISLPKLKDCFMVSPSDKLLGYRCGHFLCMEESRLEDLFLPPPVEIFTMNSTPKKKTDWLFRKQEISNRSYNRLQIIYPLNHRICDLGQLDSGFHPILFRNYDRNILPLRPVNVDLQGDKSFLVMLLEHGDRLLPEAADELPIDEEIRNQVQLHLQGQDLTLWVRNELGLDATPGEDSNEVAAIPSTLNQKISSNEDLSTPENFFQDFIQVLDMGVKLVDNLVLLQNSDDAD